MKVLCTCVPGRGRFEIMAPLAREIQRAGHSVVFVAPEGFTTVPENAGFKTVRAGLNISRLVEKMEKDFSESRNFRADQKASLMFMKLSPSELMRDLIPFTSQWKPDIILHEEGEYAGPLLAASLKVPCVTIGWPVAMRLPKVLSQLNNSLKSLWADHNQKPKPFGGVYQFFLDTCPPSLQSPHAAIFSRSWKMRPELFSDNIKTDISFLENADYKPVVHITFGTVLSSNDTQRTISTIIEGLKEEEMHLILTTGDNNDPGACTFQSKNLWVYKYVPHAQLLPSCDFVICHGGAGSTIAALIHGLPLLIIPQGGASQFRNAHSCSRIGVARVLADQELTPENTRQAVNALISEPAYRIAAGLLAHEIRQMPGSHELVAVIEQIAAGLTFLQ